MIQTICYAFIYLFEVLACFVFYENFYHRKNNRIVCFIMYVLAFVLQYGMSFVTIPLINLISFIVCNFFIAIICYESKIKTCVFTTLMLSFFMLITELIVIYSSTFFFKIYYLSAWEDNILALILQSSTSKLLFFVVIFFLSKILKNKATKQSANKFTILLGILPLTSMVNFVIMFYWGVKTSDTSPFNAALSACSILLLFANLFVFYIYEMVQKTNLEITQLQLEKQRSEISSEHYDLLYNEIENFRILKHDMKNHLRHISNKTTEGDLQGISDYIKSISEDFGLDAKIQYSGNKLIDVILNRHMTNCKRSGLNLEIGSCGSNLEFMSETDTIALLDNLFENAIEAAAKSTGKKLHFSMYRKANNYTVTDYIVITLTNSCDNAPRTRYGELVTSKSNSNSHGIGTKSIKRIVNKYNGNFDWQYDEENKEFKTSVILHISS